MCFSDKHADIPHGGEIKKKCQKHWQCQPIEKLNDERHPQQDTHPMEKYNMNMNTDTSATDTIQGEYSMQNLKQDTKQDV